MKDIVTVSGAPQAALGNAISDAIVAAVNKDGLGLDDAVCIAIAVAADYGRAAYGTRYLASLAQIVLLRAGMPEPDWEKPK